MAIAVTVAAHPFVCPPCADDVASVIKKAGGAKDCPLEALALMLPLLLPRSQRREVKVRAARLKQTLPQGE